jgi:hypothetical protein
VARRVLLVASGGLMLTIAAAIGWRPGDVLAGDARSHEPGSARRASTAPRSSPRASRAAHVTSTDAPSRPDRHPKQQPAAAVADGIVPAEPVYYLDDGPMTIALTIDDGPSPIYTPQVLRILEKYHVTASFSMVGENVTYYPGIARDVADAGHVIVNHTWDHSDLALMTASQARTEIARATADPIPRPVRRLVKGDARVLRDREAQAARLVRRSPRLGPAGSKRDRQQHHEEHPDGLDHPGA